MKSRLLGNLSVQMCEEEEKRTRNKCATPPKYILSTRLKNYARKMNGEGMAAGSSGASAITRTDLGCGSADSPPHAVSRRFGPRNRENGALEGRWRLEKKEKKKLTRPGQCWRSGAPFPHSRGGCAFLPRRAIVYDILSPDNHFSAHLAPVTFSFPM